MQGGTDIASKTISDLIKNPASVIEAGLDLSQTTIHVLEEVQKFPREQGKWLMNTATKTLAVAGHVIKSLSKRS